MVIRGTTGTPKAALLSHHTLVNNSYYIGKRMNLKHKVGSSSQMTSHWSGVINHCSARSGEREWKTILGETTLSAPDRDSIPILVRHESDTLDHVATEADLVMIRHRICLPLPLFHVFGSVIGVLTAMQFGATLVLPSPSVSADFTLKAIQQENCTFVYGTPTMHVDVLSLAEETGARVPSLETVVTGGASCSEHLMKELLRVLGVDRVTSLFGMTETGPLTFQVLPDDPIDKVTRTVGCVSEHIEVKVVDPEGNMVPMGSPGELLVRGYCNMLEYWGDEDKTRSTLGRDRWLRTGGWWGEFYPRSGGVRLLAQNRVSTIQGWWGEFYPRAGGVRLLAQNRAGGERSLAQNRVGTIQGWWGEFYPRAGGVRLLAQNRVSTIQGWWGEIVGSEQGEYYLWLVGRDRWLRTGAGGERLLAQNRVGTIQGWWGEIVGSEQGEFYPGAGGVSTIQGQGLRAIFILLCSSSAPLSRLLSLSSALAQAALPTLSTAWTAPQPMFSKPSVTSSPLYSAPKRTPASIGSRDGHCLSSLHAPMGSPCFSHWTRPGSSGGYLIRAILLNPLSLSTITQLPTATHVAGTSFRSTTTHIAGTSFRSTATNVARTSFCSCSTATHVAGTLSPTFFLPLPAHCSWISIGDLYVCRDQFVLTEDGYGRIVGRLKEMINRGGENIFPKEIEDFLQTHPDILEAQVFGVDDVRLGEVVACSLRLKEGSALTQEDIRAYCKGMIAHFKIPKYFKFVTEFSKTSSGKIQKFKLKEEITKELESQKSFGENNSQLSTTTGAGESRK
uniref:Medium-chain acyl-CoA ligase ACSF2, mitochondrial n=1 Tax=Timema tahoe TaxID=61484 RepID=A0A7R9IBA3_9NEOP|nr:unnamed protein product [Timema tahoe]